MTSPLPGPADSGAPRAGSSTHRPATIVVLASGMGTNCEALIDACASGRLNAQVAAVITNRATAGVIGRAERRGIETVVVRHRSQTAAERRSEDRELIDAIAGFDPHLVVLAGWMRVLGDEICRRFRIINLHPAQPGAFPGTNAIERAFNAWCARGITTSGAMVHWVPDSGVDVGPVILTVDVPLEPGDTLEKFEARMHRAEHQLIVAGTERALRDVVP